jgi:predicted kinase
MRELRMAIVKQLIWKSVERLIALNTNVILDYGFWSAKERIEVSSKIKNAGGMPILYFLDIPLDILKQRLNKRNSQLPPGTFEITMDMLEMFVNCFEHPLVDEGIKIVEISSNLETKNNLNF